MENWEKVALSALEYYEISCPRVEFIRHNENLTCKVMDNSSEQQFVLRVHKSIPGFAAATAQHSLEALKAEMEFIQAIGIYPTGTLIELSSGEVGVITEQNAERRLRPKILLLLNRDKTPLKTPKEIDLTSVTTDCQDNTINIARSLPHGTHGIDLSQHHKGALARMLGIGNRLLRN